MFSSFLSFLQKLLRAYSSLLFRQRFFFPSNREYCLFVHLSPLCLEIPLLLQPKARIDTINGHRGQSLGAAGVEEVLTGLRMLASGSRYQDHPTHSYSLTQARFNVKDQTGTSSIAWLHSHFEGERLKKKGLKK